MPFFGGTPIGVVYRHVVSAMVAFILFLVCLMFYWQITIEFERSRPAIVWHGARALTPVVSPGQNLMIEYETTVNKTCPADIRGVIRTKHGITVARLQTILGGYAAPTNGPHKATIIAPIPEKTDIGPFQSGEYVYRRFSTRYCPEGIQEDVGAPDVPFRIEAN